MLGSIVLYSWPLVVVVLFRTYSGPVALLASILSGYLLLPTQISLDLPGLPPLNKDTIPAISALFAVLVMGRQMDWHLRPGWLPQGMLPRTLVLVLVVGAFFMVITNGDVLVYGPTVRPGLRPWDAFSTILSMLTALLPFFLARKLLAAPNQQRLALVALAVAGAAYSLPALYEVRMSPQLNNMIYGFFPHSWLQHIRGDGFRPIVFLQHGLWLGIFFSATVLASFGLALISKDTRRVWYLCCGLWLLMTLFLSKSLGAVVITIALLSVILLTSLRSQLMIAAILAVTVLIYPTLRSAGLIPVERIMEWAELISTDRASSLGFRLANEDLLLEKALQRPLFGWGGWARNFVIDEDGQATTITDGYWVLIIGIGGWIRYVSEFGLLCLPVLLAALRARRYGFGLETSVLALILTGNLVDLIPNATITPVTWLIAGSIWGRLELGQIAEPTIATEPAVGEIRRMAYSRVRDEEPVTETARYDQKTASSFGRSIYTRQADRKERGKASIFKKQKNH